MSDQNELSCHHGVLMNLNGHGLFIIGDAGIGKSSFALELLHRGYQLIADDVVEFTLNNEILIGSCPQMSAGFIHSRELGLIAVTKIFGDHAFKQQHRLDYVLELKHSLTNPCDLSPALEYEIQGLNFPLLQLATHSSASLYHRLFTWLAMQETDFDAVQTLKQRQHKLMNNKPQD